MRPAAIVVVAMLMAPGSAAAQNSVYGLVGIGFPGDPLATRARSLGGGTGAFDIMSALNPGTVAGLGRLVAGGAAGASPRPFTARGPTGPGPREKRGSLF